MLRFPAWLKYGTILVLLAGIVFALPNALPGKVLAKIPSWLPSKTVNLGLDLQGGSYLLLEIDLEQVQKDKAEALMGDIRSALRKASIPLTDLTAQGNTVRVRITDMSRYAQAKTAIQELNPTLTGSMTRQYDVAETGNGAIALSPTATFAIQTRQQILEQSIEVVRRRIDALGTREPSITKQGDSRIVVEVPGLQDPTQLKAIIGKTAKMTFRLVNENADPFAKIPPIGDDILTQLNDDKAQQFPPLVVHRRVIVSGDRLTDASQGFHPQNGTPVVNFRFDSVGARQFGDATKNNVGHRFAIVLDQQVISAPNINTPILGGSGYIEGSFTVETAKNLSILMRAGALPAPLNVIEERTVGAELGSDSVKAGRYSALAGLIMVGLFMVLRYGLFGLFADVALTFNVVLLLAILTPFATLTLPGIAGIVLTMGMAVDANVLIYERIREEQRAGRGMLAAIDTGFKRAMATIFDANMTHLIAALVLFQLASGPVRGFAVALGIGILTSFFTSVTVTRLIVVSWFNAVRPRVLKI